ncbi:MAG: hypothetical protein Kow00121_47990 [Elainellaceae cyanobacterium]
MNPLNELKSIANAEVIRAFTPMFIAAIGGAIGLTVLFVNTDIAESGFGLASTAIAGAAGLAQPNKGLNKKDE